MPVADFLIYGDVGNNILSSKDIYYRYNQIYVVEEGIHKTAFKCTGSIGTFEWVVIPLGLKMLGPLINEQVPFLLILISYLKKIHFDNVVVKSNIWWSLD